MLLPPIEGWDLRCRHHQQALAEVWQAPETAAEARQALRQPQQQRQGWPLQVLEPHWPGAEPLPGLARAPVLQLPPLGQLAVAHQQVLEPRHHHPLAQSQRALPQALQRAAGCLPQAQGLEPQTQPVPEPEPEPVRPPAPELARAPVQLRAPVQAPARPLALGPAQAWVPEPASVLAWALARAQEPQPEPELELGPALPLAEEARQQQAAARAQLRQTR